MAGLENLGSVMWGYVATHAIDFISAILILVIGYWVAMLAREGVSKLMVSSHVDPSIRGIVVQFVYFLILLLAVVASLSKMGIPMTSFVAILGGIGVGVGLALKDNVSNLAAGILIILFRPFRVGDYVLVESSEGTVTDITLINTHLQTLGLQDVVVPNSTMTSSIVHNYSKYPTRCAEMLLDVGYDTDLEWVLGLLRDLFRADEDVLNAEMMPIGVKSFGSSSIVIYARPEIESYKYWDVYYRLMKNIKVMFDQHQIEIPFPQRVVHVQRDND